MRAGKDRQVGPMEMVDDAGLVRDRAEIRLLGPLRVRRADGSLVDPREWRTGQTADLLRLLALNLGDVVPVDVIVDALWPGADSARGRASLRTAASQIRKTLGDDCVERSLGGLILRNAWVDAHAFQSLARAARRHVLTGAAAEVVTTTREAESLHLEELRWNNTNADWALRQRDALAHAYREMVADAADAAVSLSWWHDALDFAERSVRIDPCSERGYRALMRGFRGTGETSRALQAYERCRRHLADELGADPSAETQALYLELLDDEDVEVPQPDFCGRVAELRWIRGVVQSPSAATGPVVVCVIAGAGNGKSRFLDEAWRGSSQPVVHLTVARVDPVATLHRGLRDAARQRQSGSGAHPAPVILLDDAHLMPLGAPAALVEALQELDVQVTVVVAGRPSAGRGPMEQLVAGLGDDFGRRAHLLRLPPLTPEEVAELSVDLLHGKVSPKLVRRIVGQTGGVPGAVLDLVRGWARAGRISATTEGLVLVDAVVDAKSSGRVGSSILRVLADTVNHLSGEELEVLLVVAVLDQPVFADRLMPLTPGIQGTRSEDVHRKWLQQTLDDLADRALVTAARSGFTVRDPLLRDALLSWLRPSALRQLHRRIAERAHIRASDRVTHWREAGEPELARAATLEAVATLLSEGRYEHARPHLRQLTRNNTTSGARASDRLEMSEQLGDVCTVLGRVPEAGEAYAAAADVAQAHRLPDLDRVHAKLRTAAVSTVISTGGLEPPGQGPGAVGDARTRESGGAAPAPAGGADEPELAALVQTAEHEEDPQLRSAARVRLTSTVCLPRRHFWAAPRLTTEALALTADPALQARTLVAGLLPSVVLGNGAAAHDSLARAAELAEQANDRGVGLRAAALRCLVAHDLGRHDFESVCAAAADAGAFEEDAEDLWVLIRTATERGDLATAEAADRAEHPPSASPMARQLRDLSSALLALELGRTQEARTRLWDLAALADQSGSTLVVPEVAARLVILEAPLDLDSARERFDLFDATVDGDQWLPRENVLRLLARAAMRAADHRPLAAAAAAAAAAEAAERMGLVYLAACAHRHRAGYAATAAGTSGSRAQVAGDRRQADRRAAPRVS